MKDDNLMNLEAYRSPCLPRGHFRKLNCLHLHIDGGSTFERILPFLHEARDGGLPSKLTRINKSVAGPQRAQEPETYTSHTPGSPDQEEFNYFATIALSDRDHAISVVRKFLPVILSWPHFVIEVERVVAVTEGDAPWSSSPKLDQPLTNKEVGYSLSPSLPIEIHHGFDAPVILEENLSIDQVLSEVTRSGIAVGGWFVFDKPGEICFRSNAFTGRTNYLAKAAKQHDMIASYLKAKDTPFKLWTTVEQVLGIWNSSASNTTASLLKP